MVKKCDFSVFLAFFKISFSSLHNSNYNALVIIFGYRMKETRLRAAFEGPLIPPGVKYALS